jgi:HAD superfamily hydrolase (TIGR01509 family)
VKHSNIKAVIFDHGGVLTRGGESGTNEKAASRGLGLDEVIVIPDLNDALKRGNISNLEYVEQINSRFPDAPRRLTMAMWDEVYDQLAPDPDAYAYAHSLHDRGLTVGMLSSINALMAARLSTDGSYNGFSPLVLSCDVRRAKPEPEIYQVVEGRLPTLEPQQILFLDDQEKCCLGAQARGWQTIRVDATEQMIRDTERLLENGVR